MNILLFQPDEVHPDGCARLTDRRAAHICRVLKASPGKHLRAGVIDGPRGTAEVLHTEPSSVTLRFCARGILPDRPPIDLLLALPRPKVMKRLWSTLAELGVGRIILTNAEKVERFYFDSHVLDPAFYTPRLIEGLEQAGDTRLPNVHIVRQLKPFLEDELDLLYPGSVRRHIADPSGPILADHPIPSITLGGRILLAIGPEGGWSDYERDLFRERRFEIIGLGPRILRTETACVALLSRFALSLAHETQSVDSCAGDRSRHRP